jgi:hypothetical protein
MESANILLIDGDEAFAYAAAKALRAARHQVWLVHDCPSSHGQLPGRQVRFLERQVDVR